MDLGYTGSAAAITGGSKGMGRATAVCLASEGARVALLARGQAALNEAAEACREAGSPDVVAIAVDVGDRAAVERAFAQIDERWDALNVLVHTVGPGAGRLEELSDDDWAQAFRLGTMAAVHSVTAALPLLRKAEWARIVTVSAHSVQRQNPMLVSYTAAKAALTSVTKNLAKSLAADGILVNTVSPGTIVTETFTENLRPHFEKAGLDPSDPHDVMGWIGEVYHHPADLGRAGLPEEVASLVAFLASHRNGYVTGANVNIDGGSDFI